MINPKIFLFLKFPLIIKNLWYKIMFEEGLKMPNNNNRNDWSDLTNEQRNKARNENAKANQKNMRSEQRNQGDQARQNNRADQCTNRKEDF